MPRLTLHLFLTSLFVIAGCGSAQEEEATGTRADPLAAVQYDASLWPFQPIRVCWRPSVRESTNLGIPVALHPSEDGQDDTAAPGVRETVRQHVTRTWQKETGVRFSGWDWCTHADEMNPDVVAISRRGTGPGQPPGLAQVGYVAGNVDDVGDPAPAWVGLDMLVSNIGGVAIHELGHVLGFYHEQERDDWGPPCGSHVDNNENWWLFGDDPDMDSIMASFYCNNVLVLSPTDILGARELYGVPARLAAVYATRQLQLNDRTAVRYPASGGYAPAVNCGPRGTTRVGVDSRVGDLYVNGSATLANGSRVEGLAMTQTLTKQGDASVAGEEYPMRRTGAWVPDLPYPAAWTSPGTSLFVPAGWNGPNNDGAALTPGTYGVVTVQPNATLRLLTGVYFFTSLTVEADARLEVDTSGGPVRIFLLNDFIYRGTLQDTDVTESGDILVMGRRDATLESPFQGGTVITARGVVRLQAQNTAVYIGAFYGNTVELHQDSTIVFRPFRYPWFPGDLVEGSACGDGIVNPLVGEFCDDGNQEPGDDCNPACVHYCVDGEQDEDETDIDCGGAECDPCADGYACLTDEDCEKGWCVGGACTPHDCNDGILNGHEADIDCGFDECYRLCPNDASCFSSDDCVSHNCVAGTCIAATCSDGIQNQAESDLDCGGPYCDDCQPGQSCLYPSDCTSGLCVSGLCGGFCDDLVRNGDETDVDCGGSVCEPCGDGAYCTQGTDCTSGVCSSFRCQAATCTDDVQNQDESDVDCGGACGPTCRVGDSCEVDQDCMARVCTDASCEALADTGLTAEVAVSSDWGSGYCASVVVSNETTTAIASWEVFVEVPGATVSSSWNGGFTQIGELLWIEDAGWNGSIQPGAERSDVGFCVSSTMASPFFPLDPPVVLGAMGE